MSVKIFRKLYKVYSEKRNFDNVTLTKKIVDILMFLIAILSIFLIFCDSIFSVESKILSDISIIIDFLFLFDYCMRIYFSGFTIYKIERKWTYSLSKSNYFLRWYGIIDILSFLPSIIFHLLHLGFSLEEFAVFGRIIRLLRIARIMRLFKSIKIFRDSKVILKLWSYLNNSLGKEFKLTIVLLLIVVLVGTFGISIAELANPKFKDYGESFFWSFSNLVGSGDISSVQTPSGRFLGIFIIISGLIFISIITGSFTTYFLERLKMNKAGKNDYNRKNHILICGYNSKLDEILKNFKYLKETSDIVLLNGFQDDDKPYPVEIELKFEQLCNVFWVKGNPTNSGDLEKVNPAEASFIIILSDSNNMKSTDEGDIDARSLMSLMLINELFEKDSRKTKKEHNKYAPIIIELCKKESYNFAKTHGASAIIYTDQIIGQFVTMNLTNRNNLTIFERLLDPMDQDTNIVDLNEVYIENMQEIKGSKNILTSVNNIFNEKGSLLLGFQFTAGFLTSLNKKELNPLLENLHVGKYVNTLFENAENKYGTKKVALKDDVLIIVNPWQEHRRLFCEYLLNKFVEQNNANIDKIFCVILKDTNVSSNNKNNN